MDDLTEKIKQFAKDKGACLVGIASPDKLSNAPEGWKPWNLLPNVKSLISVAVKLNRTTIFQLPKTLKEYRLNYDLVNNKLNNLVWEISCFLEEEGYEAIPIPASTPFDEKKLMGDISHKHVAVAAGLGKFGLNNLVLTPKYGPYVRFATVLTSVSLNPDKPLNLDICLREECLECIKICPVKALDNPVYNPVEGWRINKEKCYHYLFKVLGLGVCGLCIKVCPIPKQKVNFKFLSKRYAKFLS